jgi:hypothetical protein
MVRLGSLFLGDGLFLTDEREFSSEWLEHTLAGAPDSRDAFADSPGENMIPGGMYRNQMCFPYAGSDVVLCLGIHGQMVHVNRRALAVVAAVKLSTWPVPQDPDKLFPDLRAFNAISAALVVEAETASAPVPEEPAPAG